MFNRNLKKLGSYFNDILSLPNSQWGFMATASVSNLSFYILFSCCSFSFSQSVTSLVDPLLARVEILGNLRWMLSHLLPPA
jgi:hypothetical protein